MGHSIVHAQQCINHAHEQIAFYQRQILDKQNEMWQHKTRAKSYTELFQIFYFNS